MLGGSNELRQRATSNAEGAALPDTAAIYRPGTAAPNHDFGSDMTYALLDTVAAGYWPVSGQEALTFQILDVVAHDIVVLPANTDINAHDEIVYTISATGVIHHFRVESVQDRSRERLRLVAVTEYPFNVTNETYSQS